MEGRFEFVGAEVIRLLDEAFAADERLFTEAQRYLAAGVDLAGDPTAWFDEVDHPFVGAPAGLWLMNDRGIYLRSNARGGGELRAHAAGYLSELPVGNEKMCEFIDGLPLRQLQPSDTLVVTVGEAKIGLSLLRDSPP
jgi:hypothetical protein